MRGTFPALAKPVTKPDMLRPFNRAVALSIPSSESPREQSSKNVEHWIVDSRIERPMRWIAGWPHAILNSDSTTRISFGLPIT
jgi:hypothetical protein